MRGVEGQERPDAKTGGRIGTTANTVAQRDCGHEATQGEAHESAQGGGGQEQGRRGQVCKADCVAQARSSEERQSDQEFRGREEVS